MSCAMPPRKILIVTQYYHPDITACAFRMKETADILAARGHSVEVICAVPHRGWEESPGGAASPKAIDDGKVPAHRVPIVPLAGRGKINFLAHYTSFMGLAVLEAEKLRERFDLVIASSPPLFVAVAGFLTARRRGVPFFLDIRDLWPDSAVTVGQISRDGSLYKWAKRVELTLYRASDALSCVANPMADEIEPYSRSGRPVIVYNGVSESYLADDPALDAVVDQRLRPGTINVVYVGNMGYCQDSGVLLDAAKALQDAGDRRFFFHLIGDGVEREPLRKRSSELGLSNLAIPGTVNKREAMAVMRRAGALFLQLKPDATMEKTIPSKVFDYLAAGRPILFGIEGEGRTILERSGANLYFSPGSKEGLLSALKRLGDEFPLFDRKAAENRELVRREFSRERLIERMEERFQRVLGRRSRCRI